MPNCPTSLCGCCAPISQAKFGPQVVEKARQKQMGIMALKAMAKTTWSEAHKSDHPHPKCWYEPAAFPEEAALAFRWTLSQPITAAIPPGDERYFRLGMDIGQNFQPIADAEQERLHAAARGVNYLPSPVLCNYERDISPGPTASLR